MDIGIHGVNKIVAESYSQPIRYSGSDDTVLFHVQKLHFVNKQGKPLGTVTMYLDSPDAAMPVGDMSRLIKEEPLLIED